ncbi:MAG: DUF4159 domain-containing protein [Acidobacteriota bacterium]
MRKRIVTAGLLIAAMSVGVLAQRGGGGRGFGGGGGRNVNYDPGSQHAKYDGRWAFVRLRYTQGFGRGGPAWAHDWPDGEHHFMQILDGVTNLDARLDATQIMTLDDPELMKYPIAYMAEPGYWTVNDKEAESFRAYLQKGGFAIFDDFHYQDWPYFEQTMRKVLPDAKFIDLTPAHPIYHTFFEIDNFEIVKQYYDPGRPIFRAIFEDNDPKKRMLCMINYNTDISEFWEWSPSGFKPISESNEAYQIGVNWIIYGMTR